MSGRVYLLGVGLVLIGWAFLLTDELFWEPGVSPVNVNRIRPSMPLEQAEGILGKAARVAELSKRSSVAIWDDGASYYVLAFLADGRVRYIRASWYDAPKTPTLLSRLRGWLGW